jgi:hypothetical protein
MAYYYEQTIRVRLICDIENLASELDATVDIQSLHSLPYQNLVECKNTLLAKCEEQSLMANANFQEE